MKASAPQTTPPSHSRYLSPRVGLVAGLIVLACLAIGATIYWNDLNARRQALSDLNVRLHVQGNVRTAGLEEDIERLRRDALFLSAVPPVQGIVRARRNHGVDPNDGTLEAAWTRRLQAIFAAYAMANPDLAKLRLIGVADDGLELVRVNQGPNGISIVPADQLQKKGGRDFFVTAKAGQAGDVYVSNLDLNQEHGKVQEPIIPTLRAATPVFAPDGKLFGMVVVNLYGDALFKKLTSSQPGFLRLYLLNSAGDYLINPNPALSFGFELGHRHRWSDDFAPVDANETRPSVPRDYETAQGLVHSLAYRIPLDEHDPHSFVTLMLVAPDTFVQARVVEARWQLAVGLLIGALIVGVMGYLYWLGQRNRRLAAIERERLAAIVDSSNDAIIGKTVEGVVTDWNDAAERMFGYTAQEAIGRTILELIVPREHQAEESDILARIGRGEIVPHFETERRRRDGSIVDVSVTVSPINASDGRIIGAAKTLRDISKQKAAEAALREAQERLVFTTQATGIGLWDWEPETGKFQWNDMMFQLYGLRRGDFADVISAWKAAMHPEDLASNTQALDDAISGKAPFDTTFRVITPSGEVRHIAGKGTVIFDPAGRPQRMLGINIDITRERQRELRIEELNETLEQQVAARTAELETLSALQRAILANAAYPIITTDLDGMITLFNPAAERMLGYGAEEVVGKVTPAIIHEPAEVVARAEALTVELGKPIEPGFDVFAIKPRLTGVPDTNEWTYIRKDGSRLPILLSATTLLRDDGEIVGYLGMVLDLTERRRNEQILEDRERFLKSITDNIPGFVSYWDNDLRCRFANEPCKVRFGKSDMQGCLMRDLLGEELFALAEPHLSAVLRGEAQHFENPFVTPEGEKRYISSHYVPDIDAGNILGFYALAWDITELKQAQTDLEQINAALEIRTKEAEAASIAKGQFLANMSHEIRSPMNAILGMLQLLERTELSVVQRGYASNAYSATHSLLGVLNDILDFSKIEAGRIDLESLPFAVDDLMREVSLLQSASIGGKDVELVIAIDPQSPPRLRGDAFRLRQVLLNLAGNAVKFTQTGEVVIATKVVAATPDRAEIEFSVRDSGIGIAADKLTDIFAGFSQAETSTTRRYGGTGLGLAISQRLVSLMGGELRVESEIGVGSRFYFTLSFDTVSDAEIPAGQAALRAPSPARDRPLRALIVDDHDTAREALLAMVLSLGWEGDAVASGIEAVEILRDRGGAANYDVVFVDWMMPGMDGFEAARLFREAAPHDRRQTIVMVTAHAREKLASRMKAEPTLLNGFLIKPVTASMLFDAVVDLSDSHSKNRLPEYSRTDVARLAGLRLLVIDDNLINQEIAVGLLSAEGATVEVAGGGTAGVAKALSADPPFDAVLMDIQMPDMDGYDATRAIRADPRMQSLPILAMTANAMASERAACLEAGMNGHLAKPINLDLVVATILEYCAPDATLKSSQLKDPTALLTVPSMPCIDLDRALSRLGGNKPLFMKVAQRFIDESPVIAADLTRYVEQGDTVKAVALLHTVKGTAGAVGAESLSILAADFESRLKQPNVSLAADSSLGDIVAMLDQSTIDLTAILDRLRAENGDEIPSPVASPSTMPSVAIDTILDQLEPLLGDANMRAMAVFAQLQRDFGTMLGDHLSPLATAINRLDFATALECCRALRGMRP